ALACGRRGGPTYSPIPDATSFCSSSASSPCCPSSCSRPSASSCWRGRCRGWRSSPAACSRISSCSAGRWRRQNIAYRWNRCGSCSPRFPWPGWRNGGDESLLDPFEDAHVVRHRGAAHIEDAAEARIPDLNVAGGPHELHGRERVHRYPRRADRMTLGLEPARGIDRQRSVLLGEALRHGPRTLPFRDPAPPPLFDHSRPPEPLLRLP